MAFHHQVKQHAGRNQKSLQVFKLVGFAYLYRLWLCISAEAGIRTPVQLPVRQFSKLLVSATHPHFLLVILLKSDANIQDCFQLFKENSF